MIKGTNLKTHGQRSGQYGGAYKVWADIRERDYFGGVFEEALSEGQVIGAATPLAYDPETAKVTIVKSFKVIEDIAGGSTTVKVAKNDAYPTPVDNMVVMVSPKLISDTGKAVTISNVSITSEADGAEYYTLTLSAELDSGVIPTGTVLTEANATGATASIKHEANRLSGGSITIGTGDADAPVNVDTVKAGDVIEIVAPPCPLYFKQLGHMGQVINYIKSV